MAATTFGSASDFTDVFVATTGSNDGFWRYDSGGTSASGQTGPGTNNVFEFMHTEASGLGTGDEASGRTNGLAVFRTVPTGTGRTLALRLCIQGAWNNGVEGLEIQARASDTDPWVRQGALIYGWTYSDSYVVGSTFTDFNGVDRTVVADGGWIDVDVAITDGATQVRLAPIYLLPDNQFRHDLSIRSFEWGTGSVTPPPSGAGAAGTEGLSVTFGGAATSGVETRARIRRRLNEIGDARLTMIGAPADLTIPEDGDTVEITDIEKSRVLFGGNVRTPTVEIIDGGELLEITVPCVGHEQRLQDTIISPADGIRIVQLDTAAEQIQEIVKLLEGESFTTGTLPDLGEGYLLDMRFKPAYAILRAIVEGVNAVLIVSPEKEVTAPLLTALPSSGETLDGTNTTDPRRSVDPKDRRTTQYLIGGALERTLAFVGDGSNRKFDLTGTEDPTDVDLDMGAPTAVGQFGNPQVRRVTWGFQSGDSYGDLSALSGTPGDSVLLRMLVVGQSVAGESVARSERTIALNTSTTASETSLNREDLSQDWEGSQRAITITAPSLDDLVLPGPGADGIEMSDPSEPYRWRLSVDQAAALHGGQGLVQWMIDIGALSASDRAMMRATFSDGTTAAEGISLSVREVSRVTVNNAEVDPPPDDEGSEWSFDLPSQQLIQDAAATALTSSQTLRVGISANRVAVDEVDDDPPVGRVLRATDVLDSDAILARVLTERESHSDPAERIRGGVAIGAKIHVDVGQTVAMDTTFAGLLQVDTPAASDVWVLSVVTIQTAGNLLRYSFATQRDRYETESLDYWRELRAAPAD